MYSVIIKNGNILDGTGESSFNSDIAIKGSKIFKIGDLKNTEANLTIDASDLYVAPGFIDLTTHSDNHWTLFSQPRQESFVRQGVTTIIGGHGGSSLAPFIKKGADFNFKRWMDKEKGSINWQTVKEFLEEISKYNLAVNFGMFAGHDTLRKNILDNNAQIATKKEIKEISILLKQALDDGALGLSVNLNALFDQDDFCKEIVYLLKIVSKYNAVSSYHIENEGKNLLPSVVKLVKFLRETKSKGHISHFKILGRTSWEKFKNAIHIIELSNKENTIITCDFFPYTSTGSNLHSLLPSWLLAENKNKILAIIKDKNNHEELVDYLKKLTLHYDKIKIASTFCDTGCVGKNIQEISTDSGLNEENVILNLLTINKLRVSIFNDVINEKNLEFLSKQPYSAIASDGVGYDILKFKNDIPHPRSFGSFPRVFSSLVKEKNILTWENAVYKMSGLPAKILGIKNRGIIKKGNYADITIIDPKNIKDKADYDKPKYPDGIKYVLVNGSLALSDGIFQRKNGTIIKRK